MKRFGLSTQALLAATLSGSIALFSNGATAKTPTPEGLFSKESATTHRVLPKRAFRATSRGVRLNREKLRRGKFFVELPGNVSFEVVRELQHEMDDGQYAWVGHANGNKKNRAVLGISGDAVAGTFRYGGKLFKLEPRANGQHVVSEVSPRDPAPELDPVPVMDLTAFDNSGSQFSAAATAADGNGSIIDVMVAYTPAVVDIYGIDGIQAMIIQAVAETNQAYANSGISTRINLVHSVETEYTTSGSMLTDLGRLRNTSDGHMDELHQLRDQHGADLVSLIDKQSGYCGLAYRMSGLSPFFASSAFSIVNHSCATGYYSFGHELGHNQGLHHDPDAAGDSSSVYQYAYGHQDPFGAFRTIMAYNCPGGCSRINHFSNPNILYNGEPTGDAGVSDNARAIDNTAPVVANFRQSVAINTAPEQPSDLTTNSIGTDGITLSWSDNSDEESGFYVERATGQGAFSQVAALPANTTGYTDTDLTPGVTYTYRVRAWNSSGISAYSDEASRWIEDLVTIDTYPVFSGGIARTIGNWEDSADDDGRSLELEELSTARFWWLKESVMEYYWVIDVVPGQKITLHTDAFTDSSDQDFTFAYSTTLTRVTLPGGDWVDMFSVSPESSGTSTFTLPANLSGRIFLSLRDSNQASFLASNDKVFIDTLLIRTEGARE